MPTVAASYEEHSVGPMFHYFLCKKKKNTLANETPNDLLRPLDLDEKLTGLYAAINYLLEPFRT